MCSLLLFLLSRDEKRQENSLKARLSSASRRLSLDEAETYVATMTPLEFQDAYATLLLLIVSAKKRSL